MPFQSTVNTRPAPAMSGDFASDGPRFFYPAGPGGLVANLAGVNVGRFAWAVPSLNLDFDGGPTLVNSFGTGPVTGFVHRNQQALITAYLAESGVLIPQGFQLVLLTGGDLWIKNEGLTEASPGQVCYADFATGAPSFGALKQGTAGGSASAIVAASAQTFIGSITNNVLTVATATTPVTIGAVLTGTGVALGTQIVSQLPGGTPLGAGTYVVTPGEQTVIAGTVMTQAYGNLTVATTGSGFLLGAQVTGANILVPTFITQLGTGVGGTGTYVVSGQLTAAAAAVSASSNVLTKWYAISSGLPGEVVRCASNPLG